MKSPLLSALICFLSLSLAQAASITPDDIRVVFSAKKIWFIADETPCKQLPVYVIDGTGKVVLEKNFTSKSADWSLDVTSLSGGAYWLKVGDDKLIPFEK